MLTKGVDKWLFCTSNQRIFVDNTPRVPDLPVRNHEATKSETRKWICIPNSFVANDLNWHFLMVFYISTEYCVS